MNSLNRLLWHYHEWRYHKTVGLFDKAKKRLGAAADRNSKLHTSTQQHLVALQAFQARLVHRATAISTLHHNLQKITTEKL